MYETFIHSSETYKSYEKHQILRSKLSGEPYTLIEEIPLDENNTGAYEDAWKTLLDHYDDPLESVSRYLRALDTIPPKATLKTLVAHFRANVTPLKLVFNKNPDIDVFSQFVIHAFLQKADKGSNLDWQRELQKKGLATFDDFLKYMQGRCKSYDRAMLANSSASSSSKGAVLNISLPSAVPPNKTKSANCPLCKQHHYLHLCPDFKKMSNVDRFKFVQKKQMCRKCLRSSCNRSCNFNCHRCKKEHNSLIHVDFKQSRPEAEAKQPSAEQSSEFLKNLTSFSLMGSCWVGSLVNDSLYALLATAVVEILNSFQNFQARAILDCASQFNFITTTTVKKLDLSVQPDSCHIRGIDSMTSSIHGYVTIKIKSCHSNFSLEAKFLIIDEILDLAPSEHFSIDDWNFPQHLKLADPKFNIPQTVDLLLGLSIFWQILKPNFKFLGTGLPRMIATQLGLSLIHI